MDEEKFEDEEFRLGEKSWDVLLVAAAEVAEMLREDVDEMRNGTPVAWTNLAELMPRRFLPKYDVSFVERLVQTAIGLVDRLEKARADGWAYPYETFLNSVAEEMLMARIIQLATEGPSSPDQDEELRAVDDLSFEDRDFEWIYDLSHDGITDDPVVAQRVGFANLKFEDWFKTFRSDCFGIVTPL